jgi:hypothetical protein
MEALEVLVDDVVEGLLKIDTSKQREKEKFQAGVGPWGEPAVVRNLVNYINTLGRYPQPAETKRSPDFLIPGCWAVEFKIARPFGDNGKAAENWTVNLLHPYEGNASLIGDCLKLQRLAGPERKAALVIGYEHSPPQISLDPLLDAFEVVATQVAGIQLGPRIEAMRMDLVHPVHQQLRVAAWEVL